MLLNRNVSVDTGIKADPCSLCTGKPVESLIKPTATSHSIEMFDSSHGYGSGEWRKQTVSISHSLLLLLLISLPLLNGFNQYSEIFSEYCVKQLGVYFVCSCEIRKITSHIQTGMQC